MKNYALFIPEQISILQNVCPLWSIQSRINSINNTIMDDFENTAIQWMGAEQLLCFSVCTTKLIGE